MGQRREVTISGSHYKKKFLFREIFENITVTFEFPGRPAIIPIDFHRRFLPPPATKQVSFSSPSSILY